MKIEIKCISRLKRINVNIEPPEWQRYIKVIITPEPAFRYEEKS